MNKKQIREEKERRQKYFNLAGTIMIVINPDQKVDLINQKGCEILGYKEEEIVGNIWFDCFLPERVREKTRLTFDQLLAGTGLSNGIMQLLPIRKAILLRFLLPELM